MKHTALFVWVGMFVQNYYNLLASMLCTCIVHGTCRFQPDKGFSGADQAPTRDGPVQFEKDTAEEDPFGLNKFLTEAKKAKRPVDDRLAY